MGKSDREAWTETIERLERAKQNAGGRPDWIDVLRKRGRMGNEAVELGGIRFASRLEADHYRELCVLQQSAAVVYFLRQVPFVVAPKVTYRLDFLVVWNRTGSAQDVITYHETKGFLTDAARIKIAAVQERYRITIRVLTRSDVRRG